MSLVTNIDHIFKKGEIGRVRKAQEDSHDMALKTPNGDVFVVCDGMGGHVGGAKASSLAVESIISYLKAEKYTDPIAALNGALQYANTQILGFANDHPEYKGMGTTACLVLMQGADVWIAHVGDSRIYLYLGKEKELHRITKDHSYVQTLVDKGVITDDEAENHPNKNRILKALGVTSELQPSFNYQNKPIHPKNGDIFLICSDGLSGMIPDSTIEKVLGHNSTLEAKGDLLIKLAMQGETVQPGGQDNCTLELIEIDNSPWPKSEFESFNPSKSGKKNGKKSTSKIVKIIAVIVSILIFFVIIISICQPITRLKIGQLQSEIEMKGIDTSSLGEKIRKNSLDNTSSGNSNQQMTQKVNQMKVEYRKDSLKLESLQKSMDSLKNTLWFNNDNIK